MRAAMSLTMLVAACSRPPEPDAQLKAALVGLQYTETIAGELPDEAIAVVIRADRITVVDLGYHVPNARQLESMSWSDWQAAFPPLEPWSMPLVDGTVADDDLSSGGYLIEPLYDELVGRAERWKKGLKLLGGKEWFEGRLVMGVARGVDPKVLDQVTYTAGQATFSRFYFWSA